MSTDERECEACGDRVTYLSSDSRCDGCVAHGLSWWVVADIAEHLGIRPSTVRAYHHRGQMPPPDQRFGRTPVWRPITIIEWNDNRPRRGDKRS